MDEATLRVLEFDKIRRLIAGFTVSGPGRELGMELCPLAGEEDVRRSLDETSEVVIVQNERGYPPIGGNHDLRGHLRQLRTEGAFLLPDALLEILSSIEAARACRRYFAEAGRAPLLSERCRDLAGIDPLRRELKMAIGARGEILDSASFELGEIRQRLRRTRERIRALLEGMLGDDRLAGAFQDRIITERGGRYVVPVRADHRGQIEGFVHDESSSGQTLFVEPARALKDNNELQALRREEQREEERILRRLAAGVGESAVDLAANQVILAHLDLRSAAARFAVLTEAVAPQIVEQPQIRLREARHPLLLLEADGTSRSGEAVPVDLLLGREREVLVISGPNTGGKTVALKTLGLLVVMVRCGLPVPCHRDSRLHLFARVYADIGDEQSIEENLSTFSGHLTRIRRILREADGDSLVLLDEAGTGTDPAEGGALAMAVLDSLRARGARAVVTTHLNLIKGYALLHDGVENAAVEFDLQTLRPTYRLHYGIPGASSAFTIARTLGLPPDVLERAEGYLGEGEKEGLELLEQLNSKMRSLESDLEETRRLKEQARQEREKRKKLLDEIETRRQAILDKAVRRAEQVVRDAESKVKQVLKEASSAGASPAQAARLTHDVRQVRSELAEKKPEAPRGKKPRDVQLGELLRIPSLGTEGEVVKVAGGEVELSVQGKRLRLPLTSLEQFRPPRFSRARGGVRSVRSHVERSGFQPVLKLVGERVDEALARTERFLDDALLHEVREVEIVHGAGEGVLRRAVRAFLAGQRQVVSFHAADTARGGDNVTIVELRH